MNGNVTYVFLNLTKTVSTRSNNHSNEADLGVSVLRNIDTLVEPDYRSPGTGRTQHNTIIYDMIWYMIWYTGYYRSPAQTQQQISKWINEAAIHVDLVCCCVVSNIHCTYISTLMSQCPNYDLVTVAFCVLLPCNAMHSGRMQLCHSTSSVRLSVCPWRSHTHTYYTVICSPLSASRWSKMHDLEWPLNVTQGVLCWLSRQMRPRRQGCRIEIYSGIARFSLW